METCGTLLSLRSRTNRLFLQALRLLSHVFYHTCPVLARTTFQSTYGKSILTQNHSRDPEQDRPWDDAVHPRDVPLSQAGRKAAVRTFFVTVFLEGVPERLHFRSDAFEFLGLLLDGWLWVTAAVVLQPNYTLWAFTDMCALKQGPYLHHPSWSNDLHDVILTSSSPHRAWFEGPPLFLGGGSRAVNQFEPSQRVGSVLQLCFGLRRNRLEVRRCETVLNSSITLQQPGTCSITWQLTQVQIKWFCDLIF